MYRSETGFLLKGKRDYVNLTDIHREVRDHFTSSVIDVAPSRVRILFHRPMVHQGLLEFYPVAAGKRAPEDSRTEFWIEREKDAWLGWITESDQRILDRRNDPEPHIQSLALINDDRVTLRTPSGADPMDELTAMCKFYVKKKAGFNSKQEFRILRADLSRFILPHESGVFTVRFEAGLSESYGKFHIEHDNARIGALFAYAIDPIGNTK